MVFNKALKIRIYPTQKQEILINKTLGCCRFIYNQMLNEHIQVYEKLKDNKRELYEYKYKTEKEYKAEFEWLKEADSIALQQSRNDLLNAYSNFFKSLSGKRKGEKVGFPKFKKKKNKNNSYRVVMANDKSIEINTNKIKIPKLGWVKFRDSRTNFEGKIKSATVSRNSTGKYFVSILYELEFESKGLELNQNTKIKGLDMSLTNFFVDGNGNLPSYEKLYRLNEPKLKHYQKMVNKKKLGSKNRAKAQLKVNKVHEKISNCRNDFTQKLSTKLIKENDAIVVENINLRSMAQCLNLGKSINDLGYGDFIHQLQYKSLWNNKLLIEADKWFASSKTCSKCGYIKKDLLLQERSWTCPKCQTNHNRDQNAGQNLVNYGLDILNLNNLNKIGKGIPEFKLVEKNSSDEKAILNQEFSVKQEPLSTFKVIKNSNYII